MVRALPVAVAWWCLAAPAHAAIATFDTLPEGFIGDTFITGGITFTKGLWFPGSVAITFAIEDASGDLAGLGFGDTFTTPNVMSVGGFVHGAESAFFRVHSWEASMAGETLRAARLDVYYINDFLGAQASVKAMLGDVVVAVDSFTITDPNPFEALHRRLHVQAEAFDRVVFQVIGGPEGGDEHGLIALFDNVELVVPAPGVLPLAAGALLAIRRRR
jgi:hypothetical protein